MIQVDDPRIQLDPLLWAHGYVLYVRGSPERPLWPATMTRLVSIERWRRRPARMLFLSAPAQTGRE
jgi:hypothetical protein